MPSDPTVEQLLVDAYQGEVLGQTFYALLAERDEDAERVPGWRTLERLERHVKARLQGELERRGLPTAEDAARRETARKLAAGISGLDFGARCEAIAASVRKNLDGNRKAFASLPELGELADFFLGHQEALLAFAETGGDPGAAARFLEATGAAEEPPLPEGLELMPTDPTYQADPAARHAILCERAPIHRDRRFGGVVVSGHDLVRRFTYDKTFFVDPRKAREGDPVKLFFQDAPEGQEPSMLFLDAPEHTRLRNLVSRSFTPRAVEKLRPVVERVAAELLDELDAEGASEFDLIERIAAPLPAIAIARILGVDVREQARFKAWSVAASEAFFDPFADDARRRAGQEAGEALNALFLEEIERRRREPADDLIGKLVVAEQEGDRLTETELVTMCNLLLIAGNVTTTDLIGNGMKNLLEHPEEHARLRAHPELVPNAVEEMLRFEGPVQATGRIAPEDMEVEGIPIHAGESLNLLLAAANRDPAVYPDPHRFDVAREDTHHQSFGGGAHLCLGAHLARAEAQAAVAALVGRYPELRPAGGEPHWKTTPGFRGLSEYRVRR